MTRIITSFLIFSFSFVFQNVFAQLTSTNLPIVIISTPASIDTLQQQGTISIINNGSGTNTPTDVPQFTGMIGIDLRGSSTNPKLSYSVETWSANSVSTNVSLLGMPAENDWVLISNYNDRSLLRTLLSNGLHERMGNYAPRMKLCEVLVNNQYQGIYLLGEKIKRDSLRVDVAKLTNLDVSGENMTGGYILKLDNGGGAGWNSLITPPYATTQTIKFIYEEPNNTDLVPVQKSYIKAYVDSFETALNATNFQDTLVGWRKFAAVTNFIEFMIIQEISKNEEAYRINTYLHKDKNKKLRIGPLWDGELSWKNTTDCGASVDTGFAYNIGSICGTETRLPAFWWSKFTQDTSFMKELKCTYKTYRKPGNILDTMKIFQMIDSVSSYANAQNAITRNFTQWPIWGVPLVNEPTPMATNHAQEIANMKQFIKARLTWLDAKWAPTSICADPASINVFDVSSQVEIYPNPTNGAFNINLKLDINSGFEMNVFNIQGMNLLTQKAKSNSAKMNLNYLPSGIYFVQIKTKNGVAVKKIVKE